MMRIDFSKMSFLMRSLKQQPDSTFVHPFGDYNIIKAEVEKSNGLLRHNVVPGPRFLTGEWCAGARFLTGEWCIDLLVRSPFHVEV